MAHQDKANVKALALAHQDKANVKALATAHQDKANVKALALAHQDKANVKALATAHQDKANVKALALAHQDKANIKALALAHQDKANIKALALAHQDKANIKALALAHQDKANIKALTSAHQDKANVKALTSAHQDKANIRALTSAHQDKANVKILATAAQASTENKSDETSFGVQNTKASASTELECTLQHDTILRGELKKPVTGGSCHEYRCCHNKHMSVMTKHIFCHNKCLWQLLPMIEAQFCSQPLSARDARRIAAYEVLCPTVCLYRCPHLYPFVYFVHINCIRLYMTYPLLEQVFWTGALIYVLLLSYLRYGE